MAFPRPCKRCGEIFPSTTRDSRTCEKCATTTRKVARDEYWKNYWITWIEKNKSRLNYEVRRLVGVKSYVKGQGEGIINFSARRGFGQMIEGYQRVIKIILHYPKEFNITRLKLNSMDWCNIVYLIIKENEPISMKEILNYLKRPNCKHIRNAVKKLIGYRRINKVNVGGLMKYTLYYDKYLSYSRKRWIYQCPKCKRISTKEDEINKDKDGGLAFNCYCEFVGGGKFIKLNKIKGKDLKGI